MALMTCKKCGEEKPQSEFYFRKEHNAYRKVCKVCVIGHVKAKYAADPVAAAAAKRAAVKANPEAYKAISKRTRVKHADAIRQRKMDYYASNAERLRAEKSEYRKANPEAIQASKAKYAAANPEKLRALKAAGYARRADKARAYRERYYFENREKAVQTIQRWRAENPRKVRELSARRKASVKRATPIWFSEFDRFVVEEAYHLAVLRKEATGVSWELDHIVPLSGRTVCGLHVAGNFQLLPKPINNWKRHKFNQEQCSAPRSAMFVGV